MYRFTFVWSCNVIATCNIKYQGSSAFHTLKVEIYVKYKEIFSMCYALFFVEKMNYRREISSRVIGFLDSVLLEVKSRRYSRQTDA